MVLQLGHSCSYCHQLSRIKCTLLTAGVELPFKRLSERLHYDLALKWKIITCAKRCRSRATGLWYWWSRYTWLEEWTQVHSFCNATTECFLEAKRGRTVPEVEEALTEIHDRVAITSPVEWPEKMPTLLELKKSKQGEACITVESIVKALCPSWMDSVFSFRVRKERCVLESMENVINAGLWRSGSHYHFTEKEDRPQCLLCWWAHS